MTKTGKQPGRKAAFWISLGATIGVGTAFALSPSTFNGPLSVLVLIASIGVTAMLFVWIVMGGIGPINRLEKDPAAFPSRMLARVESIDEAGFVVNSRNHLFAFAVTVFPAAGQPRRAQFKQFITMGELPNFYTGRYIVVAYDENQPEKMALDKTPSPEWGQRLKTAGGRYDDVVAPNAAAEPTLRGDPVDRKKLPLNLAVVLACLLVGFFGSIACTPIGLSGFFDRARGLPARVTGAAPPLYESPQLDNALAKLRELLRDRQLLECSVYEEYIIIEARSATNPKGRDSYTFRDGTLKRTQTMSGSPEDPVFSITEVSSDTLRRAAQTVRQAHPDEPVAHAGYRTYHSMSITTSTITVNGNTTVSIPNPIWADRLEILVVTNGEYGSSAYRFDAKTGQELH